MLSYESLNILSILLLIYGGWYYLKNNDEIPVILALFNYSISISRFDLIQSGVIEYVRVNYTYNIFNLNDAKAIEAMNYILLGTFTLMLCYKVFASKYKSKFQLPKDNDALLELFLVNNQKLIIVGFFVFLIINAALMGRASGPIALGRGYFNLFKFGLGGFNLLLALLLFSGSIEGQKKIIYMGCLALGIISSYSPHARFVFLSWAIGISFLVFKDMRPVKKMRYAIPFGIAVILFFSLQGAARESNIKALSWSENLELAIDRTLSNEDQNMLDGFMMVLDVYPNYLDFQFGMEHVEILLRPIPRSWWPGKPLGGYANKLGLNDLESGTIGISQTLYGSFYGEGGLLGIVIFGLIYAKLLAWLLFLGNGYSSKLRFLIKGVIIASLIPLLRGGDLPGIYAFIGMSFWPVFIFLYRYNKFLKISYVNTIVA
ncbi:hypothetical protein [Mangrovimonas xylaniphaga]|uniref:hypothetical protein n=1 Tax=Mangrovimonas xylaniphaga TaxID=1645915 RepID=UPI0006B58496|nr:hypothetical protein [Mangrovimonas xylaniphaga]